MLLSSTHVNAAIHEFAALGRRNKDRRLSELNGLELGLHCDGGGRVALSADEEALAVITDSCAVQFPLRGCKRLPGAKFSFV